MTERRLFCATAFLRAFSTSLVAVLLGPYLARLNVTGGALGAIAAAGLAGTALGALVATLYGDRWGRRPLLITLTVFSVLGSLGFALGSSAAVLGLAAFLGMLNAMGRDRSGATVLEQAALPSTAAPAERTRVMARYTMLQDVGHALGAICAGLPTLLEATTSLREATPHRATLLGCAALGVVVLLLYTRLQPRVEAPAPRAAPRLSPTARASISKLSALFALDGLGSGFLTTALLSYYFFERFGASEAWIGALFFGARLMNAVSHLVAAKLAERIGLVRTMVLTHMPSSLLLVSVAFAPSFAVAALLFLLREGLVEMDVPTRQSYVLAIVAPHERTLATGITNLVRLAAWAVAPAFAGLLLSGPAMDLPLAIGAAMKVSYDLLLWRAFRGVRPPEERAAH